jgi:(methylthio)acryloyl-CoA hydratase
MTYKMIPDMSTLGFEMQGEVAVITLKRPAKRNALNDGIMSALESVVDNMPRQARVAVICGEGEHFSAGLDLSELKERDAVEGLHHSRNWHRILDKIEKGPIPFVAALKGACVGGGLEVASSCHVRVADETTFFAFPEGMRGIFVGGGGSVRVPKLIGAHRMMDMMLTGRVYKAAEGVPVGFAQYLVPAGESIAKAMELAKRIAQNAPMTNYALTNGLTRISEQTAEHGLFTEAMMGAIAQSAPEAKKRLKDFLEGRAAKVKAD